MQSLENYYKKELKKLIKGEDLIIKIMGETSNTRWLNVNDDSMKAVIDLFEAIMSNKK